MPFVVWILLLMGPVLLTLLTIIAGYAYYQALALALPIPEALGLFAVLLPLITALTTRGAYNLVRQPCNAQIKLMLSLLTVLAFQLFYETVIGTMALTYIVPSAAQNFRLTETWSALFQSQNSYMIKNIQDSLQCCGLLTTADRAWPFPKPGVNTHACETTLGYTQSCIDPLRESQQVVAGLFFLVAFSVFSLKLFAMLFLLVCTSWFQHHGWVRPRRRLTPSNISDSEVDNRDIMSRYIDEGNATRRVTYRGDADAGVVNVEYSDREGSLEPPLLSYTDDSIDDSEGLD